MELLLKADRQKLSSMMQQYYDLKINYPDTIIFYRLGDFYEMFFDDAVLASRILELTLTGRDCGLPERAPMCGIPYHAAEGYIAKLVEKGLKVGICEQLTTPEEAKNAPKGQPKIVKRDIVRIVTPGTTIEEESLAKDKNNFLCSVFKENDKIGICWADISTGLMETCEFSGNKSGKYLDDTLSRIKPAEILANNSATLIENNLSSVRLGVTPNFYPYEDKFYNLAKSENLIKNQFGNNSLEKFEIATLKCSIRASGALLNYINETQKRNATNIQKINLVRDDRFIHLDVNTRRNLELVESNTLKRKKGSLLGLLDTTKTAMGARKLRLFIEQPLRNPEEISLRLNGVEELKDNLILKNNLCEVLSNFQDIERKCSKVSANTILPKECLSLANTLLNVLKVKELLNSCSSKILNFLNTKLTDLSEIANVIISAINPETPTNMKDGNYIKRGFSEELDQVRYMSEYGKQWLAELEQNEKERTGIRNLKTGYNKVFGYYIEISNSWLNQVPDNYIRKQTTTTGERFITQELKDMEYKILSSVEDSLKIESKIYQDLKSALNTFIPEMLDISEAISILDCLQSFATVSNKYHYTKPIVSDKIDHIKIVEGRHPVVESLMNSSSFAPNDTLLDTKENRTMLITGPNMAGKSTYMRQVAIITLMAHIGCFVPATEAEISIVDRIFTRVGASDDLAFGQSTFMVEMSEVSNILSNATDKSLIILDEVGRGTSTYDGLSIAWAIMEYLSNHLNAKTLFATHYHELTELEGTIDGVKNYRVLIKEFNDTVIFLHKISRGSANKSFGIEVAKLAGLPEELVLRAKEVLKIQEDANRKASQETGNFVDIDSYCPCGTEVINVLRDLDMNTLSPLMAFSTLQNLVDKVKK